MKKITLLLILATFIWVSCQKDNDDFEDEYVNVSLDDANTLDSLLKKIGLPIVQIQTVDSIEPTFDYVLPPAGWIGKSIINSTKVPSSIKIIGQAPPDR